jgi:hypothetical protein
VAFLFNLKPQAPAVSWQQPCVKTAVACGLGFNDEFAAVENAVAYG